MRKYITILSLLLLFACELVVDVDVPFDGQQLTLNSFFNPDSLWSATLHLNRHVLDDGFYPEVDGATVVVFENETPIDTLEGLGAGRYRSDSGKPLQGKTYSIQATAPGYAPITAQSRVPLTTDIAHVDIREKISGTHVETIIQLKFNDNAEEVNYYHISVETVSDRLLPGGIIRSDHTPVFVESEETGFEETGFSADGLLIRDVLFNGKQADLTLKISGYYGVDQSSLRVKLRTVSEEYFKYKTTLELQRNTSGDPFAQPVNVFCNVNNGFGIFGGYSVSEFTRAGAAPEITAIDPMQGRPGDIVTISGRNFSGSQFGMYAVFTTANSYEHSALMVIRENEIDVAVPPNAISGHVYVFVNGRIAKSAMEFLVTN